MNGCAFAAFFMGLVMYKKYGVITNCYMKNMRQKTFFVASLSSLLLAFGIFAVTFGSYEIQVVQLLKAFLKSAASDADIVIWSIRLPRIVASIVAGAALSLSGLTLQTFLKNPLASPMTLGIMHGAAFGAAVSVVIFSNQIFSATVFAFLGSISSTAVILSISRMKKMSSEAVILSGVAMSSLFLSGTVLVQYLATETELSVIVFWTFGDAARSNWQQIGIMSLIVIIVFIFLLIISLDMNAMDSGEDAAMGLGVNVESLRLWAVGAAALISAVVTAFHGVIAFMGLIAPHIARRIVGADHRILIPCSALLGSLLLLAADTIGRIFVSSGALPVGVITSFMGAPMFLYFLIREKR